MTACFCSSKILVKLGNSVTALVLAKESKRPFTSRRALRFCLNCFGRATFVIPSSWPRSIGQCTQAIDESLHESRDNIHTFFVQPTSLSLSSVLKVGL